MEDIRGYISTRYGYDLTRTLDEIRPGYTHNESCQESVPEAITAFLESTSFEDALRKAVSLGGDSDTIAAIAGTLRKAFTARFRGRSCMRSCPGPDARPVEAVERRQAWQMSMPLVKADGAT